MSTAIERNILTVIEPAIMLDPLEMPDVESGESGEGVIKNKPSKFTGGMIPLVRINSYEIQMDKMRIFNLNCSGFVPTMGITFFDNDQTFMARFFPKDGDVMQLNIRSQGDEETFKPIRIDFTITDCYPVGGTGTTSANKFRVEGKMLVPNLYNEFVEYYEGTSWSSLLDVAENLQLGFASNVEETNDDMTWINPNDTREKFIQDVVANSYLDDEHFFQAYIDPYYYLTLVDINKLFSQEGATEASQTFSANPGDTFSDAEGQEDNFPNMLSNLVQMQGGVRYLGKYQMNNRTGEISNANGYKRYAQWWTLPDKEFISEFVDPLTGNTPGTIKLKGRYVGPVGEKIPEGIAETQTRYKYLGKQSENVHEEFMYSVVQNYQNNQEIHKMGMTVELDAINPALVRYSRIYCYIVEYAPTLEDVLTSSETDSGADSQPEPDQAERSTDGQETGTAEFVVNEFLSGFYVIGGIEYILTMPGQMRMRLHLLRREFFPST